jgi:hypothetical protein
MSRHMGCGGIVVVEFSDESLLSTEEPGSGKNLTNWKNIIYYAHLLVRREVQYPRFSVNCFFPCDQDHARSRRVLTAIWRDLYQLLLALETEMNDQ